MEFPNTLNLKGQAEACLPETLKVLYLVAGLIFVFSNMSARMLFKIRVSLQSRYKQPGSGIGRWR
jgi:hypothetical protein